MKRGLKIMLAVFWMVVFASSIYADEIHTELGTVDEFVEWSQSDISTMSTLDFVRRVGVIGGADRRIYFSMMEIDGILVYCLDPTVYAGTGMDYQVSWSEIDEATKQQLFRITNVGYGYPGHTDDRWFMATQLAVWDIVGFDSYYAMTFEDEIVDLSWEVAEIKRLANEFGGVASFSGQTFELDLNEPMRIVDEYGVLSHFQVKSAEGIEIQQQGNEIILTIVDRNYQKKISDAKGVTTGGLVYVYPGKQSVYMVHRSEEPFSYELNLKLKTRNLKIIKQDVDGNIAEGTHTFELMDEKGNVVMSDVKITNGFIEVNDVLPKGTYWLKETETCYPYLLNPEALKVVLNEQIQNQVIFVNEFEPVDVEIIKMDKETKELLSGAIFEVELVENEKRTSYLRTSTQKGKTSFQVPYGKSIRVCEVMAPVGYQLEKESCQQLEVVPKVKQTVQLEFYNEKKDSVISLKKVDALTKELLEGAVFEILHNGKKTTVISKKEEITLTGFHFQDEVQVCEVTPPQGYQLSSQPCQTRMLNAEKVEVEFENEKREMTLEVMKVDRANGNPLNHAEFEFSIFSNEEWVVFYRSVITGQRIYVGQEASGTWMKLYTDEMMNVSVGEFEVDAMGYICLSDECGQQSLFAYDKAGKIKEYAVVDFTGKIELPSMKYGDRIQVCEIKAPEGYSVSENACQIIEINAEEDVQQVVIENDIRLIDVQLMKHDSLDKNKLLNDAYFTYDIEKSQRKGTVMSGRLVVNGPAFTQFSLYLDENCTTLWKQEITDKNGEWIGECNHPEVYVSFDQGMSSAKYRVEQGSIFIEDVEYGDVLSVCEVIAPSGYQKQSSCQEIEVKSEDDLIQVWLSNERIRSYEEVPTMGVK